MWTLHTFPFAMPRAWMPHTLICLGKRQGLSQLFSQLPGCKMGFGRCSHSYPEPLGPQKFSRLLWGPDTIAGSHHAPLGLQGLTGWLRMMPRV